MSNPRGDLGARIDAREPAAVADDSIEWMHGFHGAIVHFDGTRPLALSELAMSRRSTGMGRMESLVALPGASVRVPPQASVGARRVAHDGASSPSGYPVSPLGRFAAETVQVEVVPAREAAVPPSGATGEAHEPGPGGSESIAAFLDRRLTDARYILLPNRSRAYAITKRVIDLLGASALLVIFLPVMAALAILIRLDSPGPAIFRQDRVTRAGRIFCFYKFRTMYADAKERFPELYDYRLSPGEFESAYYKLADDPRNTRVGRWLRRTTLDELPNLINVITGDLSLVGPRPDLPEFVRLYRPEELCCLFAKAGLTGVAQVAGRSLLTVRERLTLDMRYVAQQTVLLDLRILWRTVVVVLSGRGAF